MLVGFCTGFLGVARAAPRAAAIRAPTSAAGVSFARPLSHGLHSRDATAAALSRSRLSGLRMMCAGPDRTVVDVCTGKITAALEPKEIKIEGAYDDPNGSHITIYCVAEAFEGKRSLARQQMVFKAIWEEMQGPVHAVDTMVLKAPSEL